MKQTLPSDDPHIRPDSVDDKTVEAVGKVTEALEWVERARGDLYELHQKIGHADELFAEAAKDLEQAGHKKVADKLMTEISGLNVLPGRWTFQIVEEFNETYYCKVVALEKSVRDELMEGKQHVFESELKEKTRTKYKAGHEARPEEK